VLPAGKGLGRRGRGRRGWRLALGFGLWGGSRRRRLSRCLLRLGNGRSRSCLNRGPGGRVKVIGRFSGAPGSAHVRQEAESQSVRNDVYSARKFWTFVSSERCCRRIRHAHRGCRRPPLFLNWCSSGFGFLVLWILLGCACRDIRAERDRQNCMRQWARGLVHARLHARSFRLSQLVG
jgi:hypothetical protein